MFLCFYLKSRVNRGWKRQAEKKSERGTRERRERERESQTQVFYSLVHSWNDRNCCSWGWLKAEGRSSLQVSPLGALRKQGRHPPLDHGSATAGLWSGVVYQVAVYAQCYGARPRAELFSSALVKCQIWVSVGAF